MCNVGHSKGTCPDTHLGREKHHSIVVKNTEMGTGCLGSNLSIEAQRGKGQGSQRLRSVQVSAPLMKV